MKNLFAVVWGILFFFAADVQAEKLVFVTTEFPPFIMTKDGYPTGIHVDIVREFCILNGIEPDIRMVPWARALKEAKEGDATGFFSPIKTEERTGFLWFPSEPLDSEKTVILVLKGRGLKINKLDDLKDKTVGMVRGYSYSPEFDKHTGMKKDESVDDAMMLRKLAAGRTEFAVGEEGNLQFIGQQLGIQSETVYLLIEKPNYLTFSKASGEKGKILAEKFDQTMQQLRQEGVIEKIREMYLGTNQ